MLGNGVHLALAQTSIFELSLAFFGPPDNIIEGSWSNQMEQWSLNTHNIMDHSMGVIVRAQ